MLLPPYAPAYVGAIHGSLADGGAPWESEGGGVALFTPADLASLHGWYRADDVVLSGSSITTWTDKSPNGNDLPQGTGANQPTQVDRYGQKSASFDAGDDVKGAYHAALSQPFTIFAVAEVTSFAATRTILDSDDTTNRSLIQTAATSGAGQSFAGAFHTGQTFSAETVYGICVVFNATSSEWYLSDFTDGAVDAGSVGTQDADGLTIGRNFAGGSGLLGFVSEVIVIDKLATTQERKQVGDYFTARYAGLTVTT